jgi:hypothetical protein
VIGKSRYPSSAAKKGLISELKTRNGTAMFWFNSMSFINGRPPSSQPS